MMSYVVALYFTARNNTHDAGEPARTEQARMTDSFPEPFDGDDADGLITPQDIRSTSRSCLVILLIGAAIVLLLCVFFVVQTWIR